MTKTTDKLLLRLEDAASAALTLAHDAGKVAHKPGIHMASVKASGELAQAIVALRQHLAKKPRPAAYIVHRAMCAPELEWCKPDECLSADPLYAEPRRP